MKDKLQRAKKVPITEIYTEQTKRSGRALVGRCVLHEDDNPSLAIYPDTNSFYCFAEGSGGDVITFYMLLHRVDFKRAVEDLSHWEC